MGCPAKQKYDDWRINHFHRSTARSKIRPRTSIFFKEMMLYFENLFLRLKDKTAS